MVFFRPPSATVVATLVPPLASPLWNPESDAIIDDSSSIGSPIATIALGPRADAVHGTEAGAVKHAKDPA